MSAEPTPWALFAYKGFRRLWSARTASALGDAFNVVALGLLAYQLTGSGLGVGGVVAAEIIPVLVFGPIAGALADRVSPVRIMISADVARMVVAAVFPLALDNLAILYGYAFTVAAATVFFNPAAGTALPSLVSGEQLVAANSAIWSAAVAAQIALAPLAGVLVTVAGFGTAFEINALSFALSALVLARLRLPPRTAGGPLHSWMGDITVGARYLLGAPLLRGLALGQLLAALSAGATSALLVVLAREHLGTDSRGYGLLLGGIGAGAVLGPIALTLLRVNRLRPVFVLGPYLVRAAVDGVLATSRSMAAALPAVGVYGIATSTGSVTFTSLLQSEVSNEVRGRVLAAFDVLWQLGRLISLGLGGLAADAFGIRAVYYTGAVLLVIAGAAGWQAMAQPRAEE